MAKQGVYGNRKSDKEAYLMILPAYLIFAVFILIPVGMVLYYSLTDFNMYAIPEFLGVKNYVKLFSDTEFLTAVKNTLFYTAVTLTIQLAIGLLLAVLLYRKSRAVPVFRTALYVDFSLFRPLEFFVDPKNGDGRNNNPPAMRVRVDCYTKKLPFRVQ